MKKIIILLLLLVLQTPTFASVDLIYINGSNNNDEKMANWFLKGVNEKLHPSLYKNIVKHKKELEPIFGKNFTVNPKPSIFFWGDKSKVDLDFVKNAVDATRAISSVGAYVVRYLASTYLHDAIWVQKEHNMLPILYSLNNMIKEKYKEGDTSILLGYSAGNFITYEYLLNNLPYLHLEKLFKELNVSNDLISFVKKNPRNNTCIMAIQASEIGILSPAGHMVLNTNYKELKNAYLKLDEATSEYCAPTGAIKGTIGFANPTVLFYSDLGDPNYEVNYYTKVMLTYLLENEIFMLTVNFREDPMGFPISKNLTVEEVENNLGVEITENNGFVYDNSGIWSGRPFFLAHTSYWNAHRRFAKFIVKNLISGYRFQYDSEFQAKMLKKRSKK